MIYIIITLVNFFLCLGLQIWLQRLLMRRNKISFKTIFIFPIFAALNMLMIFYIYSVRSMMLKYMIMPVPFTAEVLFVLLSVVYLLFYTSYYLGDKSVSLAVLTLLVEKDKLSYQQIIRYFSDKQLIINRLVHLVAINYIYLKNGKYHITSRGKQIIRLIGLYRKIMNWHTSG